MILEFQKVYYKQFRFVLRAVIIMAKDNKRIDNLRLSIIQ